MTTPWELADRLIGTCSCVDPEEELGSDMSTLLKFDELAFCCEGCNWWCSTEEAHDAPNGQGFLCDDCKEETEE